VLSVYVALSALKDHRSKSGGTGTSHPAVHDQQTGFSRQKSDRPAYFDGSFCLQTSLVFAVFSFPRNATVFCYFLLLLCIRLDRLSN